jgi:hypothetical protein
MSLDRGAFGVLVICYDAGSRRGSAAHFSASSRVAWELGDRTRICAPSQIAQRNLSEFIGSVSILIENGDASGILALSDNSGEAARSIFLPYSNWPTTV